MGVRLRNSVVIIDEAHNIVEAVNAVHSVKVDADDLSRAHSQLLQYQVSSTACTLQLCTLAVCVFAQI
jgi:Rad3-related DNA helicase